jgi:two-component system response regulator DesR
VVRLLAEGTSGREIARRPHLSPGTVRNCLGHVMTRWDARNRVDVVRIGVEPGRLGAHP